MTSPTRSPGRPGRALAPFSIPLRTRFRGVDTREGVLVQGPCGWGEFSPFPDYEPATCARWLAAAREAAFGTWPVALRDRIPVNTTVPAVGPEQAHAMVSASGCRTAKVKVAERGVADSLAADLARVEAVREALGPQGKLRVDANGGWDVNSAVRAIRAFGRYDLEYVEQPVATLDEMARLRRRVDVPLAADESIREFVARSHGREFVARSHGGESSARSDGHALRAALGEAADIVVLKVQPLGGVWPALELADAIGLPVVVSSAVDTSIGLAAGLALAAALPDLPHACGLGTATLLADDVVTDPLTPQDGFVAVRRPVPDTVALARCTPADEHAQRLLDRLDAADAAGRA